MSPEKARWMLSCAMEKYTEGSRLLRVHGHYLTDECRQKIESARAGFKRVISVTSKRLVQENKA